MIWAALTAAVLAQCPPYLQARVDAGVCHHWAADTALEFRIEQTGNPENLGAEVTAIERSVATWNSALACASVSVTLGARTKRRVTQQDDENVILWRFKKCTDAAPPTHACWADGSCANTFDCWDHADAPLALAVTTTTFTTGTGRLVDADIELNWPSYLFTTVDAPPCVKPDVGLQCVATDVEGAMTHELGHALGLAHVCGRASTMYFRADLGETSKRTLDPGTALFACEAYPKGQAAAGCARDPDGLPRVSPPKQGCGCGASSAGPLLALFLVLGRIRRPTMRESLHASGGPSLPRNH